MPNQLLESDKFKALISDWRKMCRNALKDNSSKRVSIKLPATDKVRDNNSFDIEQLTKIVAMMNSYGELSYILELGDTPLTDSVCLLVKKMPTGLEELKLTRSPSEEEAQKLTILRPTLKLSTIQSLDSTRDFQVEGINLSLNSSASRTYQENESSNCNVFDLAKIKKVLELSISKLSNISNSNLALSKQIEQKIICFKQAEKLLQYSKPSSLSKKQKANDRKTLKKSKNKLLSEMRSCIDLINLQLSGQFIKTLRFQKDFITEFRQLIYRLEKYNASIMVDFKKYLDWTTEFTRKHVDFSRLKQDSLTPKLQQQIQRDTNLLIMIFSDFIAMNEVEVTEAGQEQKSSMLYQEMSLIRETQKLLFSITSPAYEATLDIFRGTELNVADNISHRIVINSKFNKDPIMNLVSTSLGELLFNMKPETNIGVAVANRRVLEILKAITKLAKSQDETLPPSSLKNLKNGFGKVYLAILHCLDAVSSQNINKTINKRLENLLSKFELKSNKSEVELVTAVIKKLIETVDSNINHSETFEQVNQIFGAMQVNNKFFGVGPVIYNDLMAWLKDAMLSKLNPLAPGQNRGTKYGGAVAANMQFFAKASQGSKGSKFSEAYATDEPMSNNGSTTHNSSV